MIEVQKETKEIANEQKQINLSAKLLGEIIAYFRQKKEMQMLMICRNILSIDVKNNVAIIDLSDEFYEEVQKSEALVLMFKGFFDTIGLEFKLKEKNKILSDLDILKEMLGEKLKIK